MPSSRPSPFLRLLLLLAAALLRAAAPTPRCRPASRRARPSRASPSTGSPTASRVAALPRRDQADDDRQRHLPASARATRTTARPAWRTCSSTWCSRARRRVGNIMPGARPPRHALQRLDVLRPHQLLRDVHRVRREPRLGAGDGSRPDGQLLRPQERPRHRDDGRAQRVRERREQPAAACSGAGMQAAAYDWHNYGNLDRSARAPTSRTSTSSGCRRSTSTYYQPDNAVLIVAGKFDPERRRSRCIAKLLRRRSPSPRARCRRIYTREPVQDGERSVTRAPRRQRAVRRRAATTRSAGAHPDAIAARRRWARS